MFSLVTSYYLNSSLEKKTKQQQLFETIYSIYI